MKKSSIATIAGCAAAAILSTGAGVANADKAVQLDVEGNSEQVHSFGSTVSDVLAKKGIQVGEHDQVVPGLDEPLSDGQTISVRFGRQITVTIDGKKQTIWTTATTLDGALDQLGVHDPGTRLSASRSTPLGREGLAVTAVTPKTVTIVDGGHATTTNSTAADVTALLAEQKLSLGKLDKVSTAASTPLADGLKVVITRVQVTRVTEKAALAFKTTTKDDSSLASGTRKTTTKGVAGVTENVFEVTTVDGKQTAKKLISTRVATKPVDQVVAVGTKTAAKASSSSSTSSQTAPADESRPSGGGLDLRREAMWNKIAMRESRQIWNINTGNGYYGGLQFAQQTWVAMGGTKYAPRADLATRAEQITIANKLYDRAGLQPWGGTTGPVH